MITKNLIEIKEYGIQFTEDELTELNMKPGDKFTVEVDENGIRLIPFATLEIDLAELDRPTLENLIKISSDQDISINEVINQAVEDICAQYTFEN